MIALATCDTSLREVVYLLVNEKMNLMVNKLERKSVTRFSPKYWRPTGNLTKINLIVDKSHLFILAYEGRSIPSRDRQRPYIAWLSIRKTTSMFSILVWVRRTAL